MVIKKNSLVIFKNHPGKVIRNINEKVDVLFSNNRILKLPEKKLLLLHPGVFEKFEELMDPGEGKLYAAWLSLQNKTVNYRTLSELIFGSFTPNYAYATWLIVTQGIYFKLIKNNRNIGNFDNLLCVILWCLFVFVLYKVARSNLPLSSYL